MSAQFKKPLTRLMVIVVMLAGTVTAGATHAQTRTHEGWYQVEMIVVARKDDTRQEHLPNNIKLRYPGDWVELKDPATEASPTSNSVDTPTLIDLTKDAFYLLPASERQLNVQAQKLQRDSRFELLFHHAWRQVITNKKMSKAVLINGGQTFGKHQALEGSIRLSVATYFELQTNLWFTQFDINVGQDIAQTWPVIPIRPNYTDPGLNALTLGNDVELQGPSAQENAQWSDTHFNANAEAADVDNFVTRQIVLLQQERDMRSNEVHYIDHPALNVIIQITPYPPIGKTAESTAQNP